MTYAKIIQSNILDPIHDELESRVWDKAISPEPVLKPEHSEFIYETILNALQKHGYDGMENWLSLVFTGSLTTYQYSDHSDVDISLWVDTAVFPEWSRAEMIGIMVEECDGTILPGTPFPLQNFVVPSKTVTKEDLYKPGVRSGYDMATDKWIVPPERSRVHDVENEMNAAYTQALEAADKMDRLLRYEPDKAVQYWHQIHKRRQHDMKDGRGDYSASNITYKMLSNRGLFPAISEASGEYIARKLAMANGIFYHLAPSEHREAIEREGLVPSAEAPESPWADAAWAGRDAQPSGVYLWDDPTNARSYAWNIERTKGGDNYPGDDPNYMFESPDFERYMEDAPDPNENERGFEEYEDKYEPRPLYDVWKVDTRGLPVHIDPETAIGFGELTPEEAQAQINEEVKEYGGQPDTIEGHRWYVPHAIPPERLTLHEGIYPEEMTEGGAEEAFEEGKRVPHAWSRVPLDQWNEKARKRYLGKKAEYDYRMEHQAPDPESGAPFHEIEEMSPDFYAHPEYYTTREPQFDAQSVKALMAARGKPNRPVTIYRAGPTEQINPGDWVTPSRAYAIQHSKHPTDPAQDMPVWKQRVPASALWYDGNSIHEYGYHGPVLAGQDASPAKPPPKPGDPDFNADLTPLSELIKPIDFDQLKREGII